LFRYFNGFETNVKLIVPL